MGGKRPDQYRIAPDEARATDYKTLPNEPDDLNAQRVKPGRQADRRGIDFEDLDSRVLKGNRPEEIIEEEDVGEPEAGER